jgi:hypothetical protein
MSAALWVLPSVFDVSTVCDSIPALSAAAGGTRKNHSFRSSTTPLSASANSPIAPTASL